MDGIDELTGIISLIPSEAKALVISTHEDLAKADNKLNEIKAFKKKVKESFDPIIEETNAAHKTAIRQRDEILAPLEQAEKTIKSSMKVYIDEQNRVRQEKERELREAARKEAEERQLREAIEAEQDGDTELAQVIINEKPFTPPPVVRNDMPKVDGRLFRKVWKFRVINPYIVPREYLKVDEQKVGGTVRAMKGETKIAGIEVYEE